MKSLLRLFKAVEIVNKEEFPIHKSLWGRTLKYGFVFGPEVYHNYSDEELDELIGSVVDELMLTPDQMNNSFHKSWAKVAVAPLYQLLVEQLIHYFTTYGYEHFGTFSDDTVYIPKERLDIPELEDGIKLTVVHGLEPEEIKETLLNFLGSGIALKEDTVKDCIDLAKYICNTIDIHPSEVNDIKNKEVKTALFDEFGIVPREPVEFLRYLVYKVTGKTLLIKNHALINLIKESELEDVVDWFDSYDLTYGLRNLAEIFNRFKPIFLAFKANEAMKPVINKISKLSKVYHKPMREDYLNNVTSMIKRGVEIDFNELRSELSKVNNFRKIRLAYALNYRLGDVDTILYKVRNGKGFVTDFKFEKRNTQVVLDVVLDSIVEGLAKNVSGKKVYLPNNIRYALPATEKQFTGNFPSGTSVSVDKDMVFGIHWTDVDGQRIDLDLSLIDVSGTKFGWDGHYRDNDRNILFSGDLTFAPKPNGASELFYVKKQVEGSYLLMVNYFNYNKDIDVPFKILVGQEEINKMDRGYMINPNNVLAVTDTKMDVYQKVLGVIIVDEDSCRFHFAEVDMGNSITSRKAKYVDDTNKYLYNFYKNTLDFDVMLMEAGVEFVDTVEECDIDLSPENIKKDDIINLLV